MTFAALRLAWGWLGANPWAARVALGVGLVLAVLLWLRRHDHAVIAAHEAGVEAAAAPAREAAAEARATDAATNSAHERTLHDAIDAAPTGGALSPAAHALACERLRAYGRAPPACRS